MSWQSLNKGFSHSYRVKEGGGVWIASSTAQGSLAGFWEQAEPLFWLQMEETPWAHFEQPCGNVPLSVVPGNIEEHFVRYVQ